MLKITAGVEGMMCDMCESHIKSAVLDAFPGTKVTANRKKNTCEILSEAPVQEAKLRSVIEKTGYRFTSFSSENYEKKKGFFAKLFG